MKKLARIIGFANSLSDCSGRLVCYLILPIFLLVAAEVVARYVFSAPSTWSSVLVQLIFGAYFVLGGAYTLLHKGHVSVDFLYARLSAKNRAVLDLITSLATFSFLLTLLWYGTNRCWIATLRNETTGLAWDVVKWPSMWSLPFATLLLGLQRVAHWCRDAYFVVTGKEVS